MTHEDFCRRVQHLWERIPPDYRREAGNLVLIVEDRPDAATLKEMEVDDPFELLGLYLGCPMPERDHQFGGELPDRILLFREPILEETRLSGDPLDKVIYETLIHELAHHLGFSEEALEPIEALWADGESGT